MSSPRYVSVLFQRGDGLQEHDHSLWLGQEAHVGEDRPGPSTHSYFFYLWVTIQHRQRVWIRLQENQTGCRNQGSFLFHKNKIQIFFSSFSSQIWDATWFKSITQFKLNGISNEVQCGGSSICVSQVIRGAGHYVFADQPDDFNQTVLKILSSGAEKAEPQTSS